MLHARKITEKNINKCSQVQTTGRETGQNLLKDLTHCEKYKTNNDKRQEQQTAAWASYGLICVSRFRLSFSVVRQLSNQFLWCAAF